MGFTLNSEKRFNNPTSTIKQLDVFWQMTVSLFTALLLFVVLLELYDDMRRYSYDTSFFKSKSTLRCRYFYNFLPMDQYEILQDKNGRSRRSQTELNRKCTHYNLDKPNNTFFCCAISAIWKTTQHIYGKAAYSMR